jgi:hypothetical protein
MTRLACLLAFLSAPALAAEPPPNEPGTKPLLSFEPDEIKRIAAPHVRKGKPQWRVRAGYPYDLGPRLNPEDASHGTQSLGRNYPATWWAGRSMINGPAFAAKRPGVYQRVANVFRTSGWHHLALGNDWSTHDRLWVDVRCGDAAATVTLQIEDDLSPAPVVRTYRVPKGGWRTLEYDLAGAEKAKLLDRDCIASLYVTVRDLDAATPVHIDHIRLATTDAKPKLNLLRDPSPWPALPEPPHADGRGTRPEPPRPPTVKPDRSPIPKDEKPVTLTGRGPAWGNALHKVPRGIAAFDNRHLASILMAPTAGLRISRDGGRSWSGLRDKPWTVLASGNNTPNRHGFFCTPTEALCLYITHCAGGGGRTETYFRRAAFDGTRWSPGPVRVVDRMARHCPVWYEINRLPNGRLWAAWDHYGRRHRVRIKALFSDDGGVTWQHGGALGFLDGNARLGSAPRLAAFGNDGVMCLWRTGQGRSKRVLFSRFDQAAFDGMIAAYSEQDPDDKIAWDRFARTSAWTKAEPLPKGISVHSAVGTPDGKVYAAVSGPSAVLVWDGEKWTESLEGTSGLLTRCGEHIGLFYKADEGRRIRWRMLAEGNWSDARGAAEEAGGVKSIAVPRVSPPNFVPLAWSITEKAEVIRTVRVPVP